MLVINRVLKRFEEEQAEGALIAPILTTQAWFTKLNLKDKILVQELILFPKTVFIFLLDEKFFRIFA